MEGERVEREKDRRWMRGKEGKIGSWRTREKDRNRVRGPKSAWQNKRKREQ